MNIIAVIWDFDKTLIPGYMQDPIFKRYDVDGKKFWDEVNALPKKYESAEDEKFKVRVNKDTIYLNKFIDESEPKEGKKFPGLNNNILRELGKELVFYDGVPEIFKATKDIVSKEPKYSEYDIKVEHYVVSTGMAEMIRGSSIIDYIEGIWGCELVEKELDGQKYIAEKIYTIDNTSKTRAIFEINKGVPKRPSIDVNAKMDKSIRRIPFENMIYIADGPSDVPAFSLVKKNGGATFAIYPKGKEQDFVQVEQLRRDGRIDMYAEANYSNQTTAYMWICNKIREYAERIYKSEKEKIQQSVSDIPKHLV